MNFIAIVTKPDGNQFPAVVQNVEKKEDVAPIIWAYMRGDYERPDMQVDVEVFGNDEILFCRV